MTKNILKTALVVLGAGSLVTGCNFEQPKAPCFVQDAGNWYAKYDPIDTPRLSDGTTCTAVAPTAERLGVYKFVDPDNQGASILTIRPSGLLVGNLATRDPGPPSLQTALGRFATKPDAEDFCSATDFSIATVDAAAEGSLPQTKVTYELSEVRVYSAPSAPGTQLTGTLKYTKDGCTSTYTVRAMWPAEPCIPGTTAPATNCGDGSGLNPDFAATCLPVATINASGSPTVPTAVSCGAVPAQVAEGYTGCCVPAKAIPSFN
jgi:hypothetical protein